MRKQQICSLCSGVFLLVALTTGKAGLLIDSFVNPTPTAESISASSGESANSASPYPNSGSVAGGRRAQVTTSGECSDSMIATIVSGVGSAKFLNNGHSGDSGDSTHEFRWTPVDAYNILDLTGCASYNTLSFVLDVTSLSASTSQNFLITVFQASNYATYGATVTGPGDAYFSYTGSFGTPNLTVVSQITFSANLPATGPNFEFGSLTAGLTAVPEPTNVALGVFGGLALAVGGVRMGRRLMIARRTA